MSNIGATLSAAAAAMLSDLGTSFKLVRRETGFNYEEGRSLPAIKKHYDIKGSPPAAVESSVVPGTLSTLLPARSLAIVPDPRVDSLLWNGAEWVLRTVAPIMAQDVVVAYRVEFTL